MNTPTAADIKIRAFIKALFFPKNRAVLHVKGNENLPNENNSNIKSVGISYDDYLKVVKFIQNTFKVDERGRVDRIGEQCDFVKLPHTKHDYYSLCVD